MTAPHSAPLRDDTNPPMNLAFSDEQQAMRDVAKGFVDRYCSRDAVRQWDDDGVFPRDLYLRMAKMGWLGLMVPEQYGGTGGSLLDMVAVYEIRNTANKRYS
jgi:alkylation response protein AidB-like acyl-CoA dehydrogenase